MINYLLNLTTILFLFCNAGFTVDLFNLFTKHNDYETHVYKKPKFDVLVKENLIYGYGLSHDSYNNENPVEVPLYLDAYLPENTEKNKPILILIHGGGFRGGDKTINMRQYVEFSQYFASRGWAVFNLNYRLLKDYGSVPEKWKKMVDKEIININKNNRAKAIYPALRDVKAAIRWVVANKNNFGVNINKITVGGGSAGGCASFGVGITENEDYFNELSIEQDRTLLSTNIEHKFQVHSIILLWGSKGCAEAIARLSGKKLYNKNNPPVFIAHGTNDKLVDFNNALNVKKIYQEAGAYYEFFPLEGKGHGPWNVMVNDKTLFDLVFDFIVKTQGLDLN